jgi:flagellar biosynthesis/type III secretory pathway protein FliH
MKKEYTAQDLNTAWAKGYDAGEPDGEIKAMRNCINFLEQEIERVREKSPKTPRQDLPTAVRLLLSRQKHGTRENK